MPSATASANSAPAGPDSPSRLSLRARVFQSLRQRFNARWPTIKRQFPRDLVIVLWLVMLVQFMGPGLVLTDSVHTSLVWVLKGAPVRQGELAAFSYSGGQIARYYEGDVSIWMQRVLGMDPPLAGPNKGDGFVKYLMGIEGDRIEVQDDAVFLNTARGRFFMGRCKPESRRGVPLEPIAPQVIPPGFAYMWAPHVDALDSRYAVMGLVPASAILGRAERLW